MDDIKPHAIMVEFLFQGHISPFIHLATALASKGCTVTYIRTEFIHHLIANAIPASSTHQQPDFAFSGARESGLDIRYATISDGFPLDFDRLRNVVEFYASILHDFPSRVDELVGKIVAESGGRRLAPFLVADAAYLWPPAVAAKYNIIHVSFWSQAVLRLLTGYYLELLKEKGLICSYSDYKDHIHGEIPGVNSRNVREFIANSPTEDDPYMPPIMNESVMKTYLDVRKADLILCSTVQELELKLDSIPALNQDLPTTYAIGPPYFLARNFSQTPIIDSLRSETDCSEWLNAKPPKSVLFVSFGSLEWTDKDAIWEIAEGLRISNVNFVWILRHDLPTGFEEDEGDRGLIIPWCNQRDVLANPAVGGFLTHCGWNSIMESIWFEVSMICYPIFMDHHTNRNMVVHDWKIGINLCEKPTISREEVAEKINSLMSGTELDELKIELKNVSRILHDALAINGSSGRNLDMFIKHLKEKLGTKH